MSGITLFESTDDAGILVRSRLVRGDEGEDGAEDGGLSLAVGSEVFPLPAGALEAVMKRYGKPLDEAFARDMMLDERLELGEGRALVRFRFMRRYDVIARDYLVLYEPGAEPLCEMATSVAAALDHLARRFSGVSGGA